MATRSRNRFLALLLIIVIISTLLSGCKRKISLSDIPEYSGNPYVEVNDNKPLFTKSEITSEAFESYSPLDSLGRCGVAFACLGVEIMPTEERSDIANILPAGWEYRGISNNNSYDFVENNYIYNRCHLIGFQLAGENDNEKNLITGTRYMNIEGMLPFENMVAEYLRSSKNHVMYRVTPMYIGMNYLPHGVLMEAYSVEDDGSGIEFCIFAYNVQPGVYIDYYTGQNAPDSVAKPEITDDEKPTLPSNNEEIMLYVLNISSKKFHYPNKSCTNKISEDNREEFSGTREQIIQKGYSPCGLCNP